VEIQKDLSGLPPSSESLLADLYHFIFKPPEFDTFIKFENPAEQKDYCQRILHRLNVRVNDYTVLNIHKIGINAPGKFVFEELLTWDNTSIYWPNSLARIKLIDGTLDKVQIYLFGIEKIFAVKQLNLNGVHLPQLFRLEKRRFNFTPHTSDFDNARSLLYDCGGGYPIGIFSLYVRSSINEENEKEMSQLFFVVAFDFFGLKKHRNMRLIKSIWQKIHNRVSANVLNRIKLICETKFNSISAS
jgi:hypothetical protein